jgi:integrase
MDITNKQPPSPFGKKQDESQDSIKSVELIENELTIVLQRTGYISARIYLGDRKYKFVSLRTRSWNEAPELAKAAYYKVKALSEAGIAVKRVTFKQTWQEFIKYIEREVAVGQRTDSAFKVLNYSGKYLTEFFGSDTLEAINKARVDDFIIWRRQRAKDTTGKISPKTLNTHVTHLKQCLSWARDHKHAIIAPLDEMRKVNQIVNRRPYFNKLVYGALIKALRDNAIKHKSEEKKYYRERLRHFVLILAQTGMRPGELKQMTWRDVGEVTDSTGRTGVMFTVSKGKTIKTTGPRQVIAKFRCKNYLDRWKRIADPKTLDELIFPNDEGKEWDKSERRFREFLKQHRQTLGLPDVSSHSLYSLRHSYATFYLQGPHPDVFWLAKHMGTSTDQILKHYGQVTAMDKVGVAMGR